LKKQNFNNKTITMKRKKVTDLTTKKIKDNQVCKLTNADISANYQNEKYFLSLDDFRGAFACWVVRQLGIPDYQLIGNSIKAYTNYLAKNHFKKQDAAIEMSYKKIESLTSEKLFCSIPEIYELNQIKNSDFIDLGALSRNVFYHILREQITQPL